MASVGSHLKSAQIQGGELVSRLFLSKGGVGYGMFLFPLTTYIVRTMW